MDIFVPISLVMAIVFNALGIILGGGTFAHFVDPTSVAVTFGGGLVSILLANDLETFLKIPTAFRIIMNKPKHAEDDTIVTLISFSEKARREGLLVLEDDIQDVTDPFLKKGMQLVVDGTDPELVKNIMNTELDQMEGRHDNLKKVFDDAAALFPAWGMIGTLIGLIIMLRSMGGGGGTEAIGSGMAVALLTTYYGAILANAIAIPVSSKLTTRHDSEALIKAIILEGILSIQSGDNPRIVKDKLVSFLPPAKRKRVNEILGEK